MTSVLKKIWKGWLRVGHFIGDIVGRVVLTLFYFSFMLPFGLFMHFFRDPLSLKRHTHETCWLKRPADTNPLQLTRQF